MGKQKIVIITGGSSGIGRNTALSLKNSGCRVYEFSRHEQPMDGIIHVTADITDEARVLSAVAEVYDKEKRIDILINNAGFGISGACEMTDSKDSHAQLELNLFGMDNVTRAVLPIMRKQNYGRIVCISSVAAVVSIPFQVWYSVSKAAINAYVLGLQNEVRPYGISVCAIMPGDISTGFTDARRKSLAGDDVYSGRISRSVAVMEHDERTGMKPEKIGKMVANIALRRHSRPLIALGGAYKAASMIVKLLPHRLTNWIVFKIYAK